MNKGDRVVTPLGLGIVAYVRMAPPSYSALEAVSVALDSRRYDHGYTGTIFAARDVEPYCDVCEGWHQIQDAPACRNRTDDFGPYSRE